MTGILDLGYIILVRMVKVHWNIVTWIKFRIPIRGIFYSRTYQLMWYSKIQIQPDQEISQWTWEKSDLAKATQQFNRC